MTPKIKLTVIWRACHTGGVSENRHMTLISYYYYKTYDDIYVGFYVSQYCFLKEIQIFIHTAGAKHAV